MKTRVAAIEFGTSKIVTVIAQSSARSNHCQIVSCGKVNYAGYGSGDWTDWDSLNKAIYNSIIAAQSDAGTPIKDIYIGVPCEFMHVRCSEAEVPIKGENGRVSIEDIQAVEDMAADVMNFKDSDDYVIHRSPAWYSVDRGTKTMEPQGLKGNYLSAKVSFIIASADFVDDMRDIMGHVGITINGFLSPALGEQLLSTDPAERDAGCVFIDAGMYNTEISVLRGDAIVQHAVLPVGGNDITSYIADELEIRYDEAEELKRAAVVGEKAKSTLLNPQGKNSALSQYKPEVVCKLVEVALEKTANVIRKVIENAQSELSLKSVVYVTGGGLACLRGTADYLENYLGRKVKLVDDLPTNKLKSPEYASTLGLVDLIFDSIEQRYDEQQTLPMRALDTFKGLFSKNRPDEDEE